MYGVTHKSSPTFQVAYMMLYSAFIPSSGWRRDYARATSKTRWISLRHLHKINELCHTFQSVVQQNCLFKIFFVHSSPEFWFPSCDTLHICRLPKIPVCNGAVFHWDLDKFLAAFIEYAHLMSSLPRWGHIRRSNVNATVSKDKHINETRYWFSFIWDIIKSIQGMRWKLKDVKTFLPGHPRSRFFDGYAARGSILLDYHEDAKK